MADETEVPKGDGEPIDAPEVLELTEEVQDEGPDPYAELAGKIGWVPKDQFKGDPEVWKPAEQYILDGKDIQKATSRELKELRSTVDNIARTSGAIFEQRMKEETDRLKGEYAAAVDDGDANKAWEIGQKINNLSKDKPNQGPAPETQEWVGRNGWFNSDPLAHDLALQVADRYAKAGKSTSEQLTAAESEVRRVYPHLFPATKGPAVVAQPGSRSAGTPVKSQDFASMPKAAQAIANDLVERKLIPSTDSYVKNYWATEGKAK